MTATKRPITRIACVGEVMIELVASPSGEARLGVAGDTYNTAVYLRRAVADLGLSVAYVTALGSDPYSERIRQAVSAHGLDTSCIERRDGMMPGLYAIDTDAQGERSFSYWRSASAARTLFEAPCDVALERLDRFDLVYLSGITLAILRPEVRARLLDWADRFRAGGGTLAYDSNYRPALWPSRETARSATREMWSRTDIALPSLDDEMALFGDADAGGVLARLRRFGATRGALKRGDGAARPRDGLISLRPARAGAGGRQHGCRRQLQRRIPCGPLAGRRRHVGPSRRSCTCR